MPHYPEITKDQEKQILDLFDLGRVEHTFSVDPGAGYLLRFESMYNYVDFKDGMSVLQAYMKIASILGVTDGDEEDRYSPFNGCPTCGFGSAYVLTLRFW